MTRHNVVISTKDTNANVTSRSICASEIFLPRQAWCGKYLGLVLVSRIKLSGLDINNPHSLKRYYMGKGRGGYTAHEVCYRDSGGHKVTDPGAIFIAECYIDMGYEVVFRQEKTDGSKMYDLTIKTSNDKDFVKNIEVKRVTSTNPSQIAKNIEKASKQFDGKIGNNHIAICLPNQKNNAQGIELATQGFAEAERKKYAKYPIEIWFSDHTSITLYPKTEGV